MPQYLKDSGFVIRRVNVGEYDRYITLYTQENGKIEVLAKGVRRINSRRSSHVELLNHIRFQAVHGKKNAILTEVQLLDAYQAGKRNLDDIGSLFLISELIEKLCPLHQKNPEIYHLIHHVLSQRDTISPEEKIVQFEVDLLTLLGFWDPSRTFRDAADIKQFIESIIERKLKSSIYFGS